MKNETRFSNKDTLRAELTIVINIRYSHYIFPSLQRVAPQVSQRMRLRVPWHIMGQCVHTRSRFLIICFRLQLYRKLYEHI